MNICNLHTLLVSHVFFKSDIPQVEDCSYYTEQISLLCASEPYLVHGLFQDTVPLSIL